ncbi:OmpA family protein, partial [Bacteroidota bacterium]
FGFKPSFGALFNYYISDNHDMSLELRASYSNIGGILTAEETQLMYYDPNNSVDGLIEHTINTSINVISLQPAFKMMFYENMFLNLGFSLGSITKTSFEQKESLKEPKDLRFENDQRTRMTYSSKIPKVSDFYSTIVGGVNYDLIISENNDFYLSPEVLVEYSLSNIINDVKWDVLSVKIGLALNYNGTRKGIERFEHFREIDTIRLELPLIAEEKIIQGVPVITYDSSKTDNIITITEYYSRIDTLMLPERIKLDATIMATALDENGNEIKSPYFEAEEYMTSKMQPLLNYVFFDENSYKIPERFVLLDSNEVNNFNVSRSFDHSRLEFYYNLLNIIGSKMNKYPAAKLTLIGSNSNIGAEKSNRQLSKNRAQSVWNYLTNIWKIKPDRLTIQSRNLPKKPTSGKYQEGHEENRRVEIYSNDIRIISSIINKDTILEVSMKSRGADSIGKAEFRGFRFYTSVTPDIISKSWRVSVVQNQDTIKTFTGTGKIPNKHDWKINSDQEAAKVLGKPLKFILTANDSMDNQAYAENVPDMERKTISIKRANRETDKKIDSYSLMLFDFGSHKFTKENRDFPKLVRRLTPDDARIKVTGYSDRVGNDDYNLKLSSRRAKAVAGSLLHPNTVYEGVGESDLLYNNDLPEGRFYCRTVDIIVETPIQW